MNIKVEKMFYPVELIAEVEKEFSDEINVRIVDAAGESSYEIELVPKAPESNINIISARFLNRFLEMTIIEKLG
jgi:hypothetical protein